MSIQNENRKIMSNLRAKFEGELRKKLEQKSSARASSENVLLRSFKHFDLDNSETVSFSEFVKAIEKIGVLVDDRSTLRSLFNYYDVDGSGALDYKEFAGCILGSSKPSVKQAPKIEIDSLISKTRAKLSLKGGKGLIGLHKQFLLMDQDNSHHLDFYEFSRAMKDYRVDLTQEEVSLLFDFIDQDSSGYLDYDEFVTAIRGPFPKNRKDIANLAFDYLDSERLGSVDINRIKSQFSASEHPEVLSGRKTEEYVIDEFLDTFEVRNRRIVTREDFLDYYHSISATIESDDYFARIVNSAWKPKHLPVSPAKTPSVRPYKYSPPSFKTTQILLDRFRTKLATRGARGIIGIQRLFRIMDDDYSNSISLGEFQKACRDFRLEINEEDVSRLFNALDRNQNGTIDYEELVRGIRGSLPASRKRLVDQAWDKLDRDNNGVIDINDLKGVYSAKAHPEVRSGKKTEDEVLADFLETFEAHHSCNSVSDHQVSKEEFQEYYANVSASIDDERYFEVMMNNAWNLLGEPEVRKAWAGQYGARDFNQKKTLESRPYGLFDLPRDFSTSNKAPLPAKISRQQQDLISQFRNKLAGRGARGILGISRQFKIMDDDDSKCLNFKEFEKALRDFRLDFSTDEARSLFNFMDADHSGSIQYEEFLHRLRGEMNSLRKTLVQRAFNKLDKDRNQFVEIDDIRGVYNAQAHPDVRSGKKSEDDVLCEFLDTFEMHHALYQDGRRDHRVTLDEFMEYYKNISASIDDDRYFELMINNSWNPQSYQRGWANQY